MRSPMQRQVFIFLTEADEAELVAALAERLSLRRLAGPYFQGDVARLLAAPESVPVRQQRRGEARAHLFLDGAALVAHRMSDGPFDGWSRIDEARSEVLTLTRAEPSPQGLAPSRLYATTHWWEGATKVRKSSAFVRLVGQALDLVASSYPTCAFDWMRVAPGARAFALRGGRLHYLYQAVGLAPEPATPVTRPHRGR